MYGLTVDSCRGRMSHESYFCLFFLLCLLRGPSLKMVGTKDTKYKSMPQQNTAISAKAQHATPATASAQIEPDIHATLKELVIK